MGTLVVAFVAATPASMDRDNTSNDVLVLPITFLGGVAASMALKSGCDTTRRTFTSSGVIHRLVNLHSSEPLEGIHGCGDLFLVRLIILRHVG